MMMPLMDGPTTIQVLRRINPGIKIIAASGLHPDSRAAKATGATVNHFLTKPYTAGSLLKTLHAVLKGQTGNVLLNDSTCASRGIDL
jgi:two-component system cell cycle sensor histidine kinase/response regulator CckA